MIVYAEEVFRDGLTGTDDVFTEPSVAMARGERFLVYVRVSQISKAGVTLNVDLQHSNDGSTWVTKAALLSSAALDDTVVNHFFLEDTSATLGGRLMRVRIALGNAAFALARVVVVGRGRMRGGIRTLVRPAVREQQRMPRPSNEEARPAVLRRSAPSATKHEKLAASRSKGHASPAKVEKPLTSSLQESASIAKPVVVSKPDAGK